MHDKGKVTPTKPATSRDVRKGQQSLVVTDAQIIDIDDQTITEVSLEGAKPWAHGLVLEPPNPSANVLID